MITPGTCAVEIVQNMGIDYIVRVEEYFPYGRGAEYDPMLRVWTRPAYFHCRQAAQTDSLDR